MTKPSIRRCDARHRFFGVIALMLPRDRARQFHQCIASGRRISHEAERHSSSIG
jgi:hypothetical protein